MLTITLALDEATWGDLRQFVALNRASDDSEPLGLLWDDSESLCGLTESIEAKEVQPRGK